MNSLKAKLSQYGVNWTEVMERFVDDEELYFDCLHSFMEDPAFSELENAIRNREYEQAFDHAHTLKGVAGNLGLAPLFVAMGGLVEPLRNHVYDDIDSQYHAVQKETQMLREILNDESALVL